MEIGRSPVGTIFKGRAMDLFGKLLLARRILRCLSCALVATHTAI